MAKFKVGDRVKIVKVLQEYAKLLGETGEIIDVDEEFDFPYEIKFDKEEYNQEAEGGWLQSLFAENELALEHDKIFHVGDEVVVVDTNKEPVPVEEHVYVEIQKLIKYIDENLPQGRATSMVKTKLDEARLWLGEVK